MNEWTRKKDSIKGQSMNKLADRVYFFKLILSLFLSFQDVLSRMIRSYLTIWQSVHNDRPPIDDVTRKLNSTLNKFFGIFEDFLRRQHTILGRWVLVM